jgi:hypothetical protein
MGRGLLAALLACALLAAPASAKTIRYLVPPDPAYTVDNATGIAKVTYNGCVTAGATQVINFTLDADAGKGGTAELKVIKEEGQDPSTTITPNPVTLDDGANNLPVRLQFTLPSANNGVTTFRFKLDPDNGAGLGEGPGVMVRIPCVLAAPSASPQSTTGSPAGDAPSGATGALAQPTVGQFPTVKAARQAGGAACVATPQRMRVRAGKRTRVRVRVATNGQSIAGSAVRVTGPGFVHVKRTNALGEVVFDVRPRRSGEVVIQSDVCFGADRVRVRPARVTRRGPPHFTG